jgi:pentatricopeptide repeat protein
MLGTAESLQMAIDRRVAKLESGEDLSKRVLKREFAALGKLQRELAHMTSADQSLPADGDFRGGDHQHGARLVSVLSPMKMGLSSTSLEGKISSRKEKRRRHDYAISKEDDRPRHDGSCTIGDCGNVDRTCDAGHGAVKKSDAEHRVTSVTVSANVGSSMTRKEVKRLVKSVNRKLAAMSTRKELRRSLICLAGLRRRGIEGDVHTYTNIINCAVRCRSLAVAQSVFAELKNSPYLSPNIVTVTALLKGLCEAGKVREAKALFDRECALTPGGAGDPVHCGTSFSPAPTTATKPAPNLRAANTLLRGCVRSGDVGTALHIFAELEAWGIQADEYTRDETTVTAVVGLLSRSLQLDEARRVLAIFDGTEPQRVGNSIASRSPFPAAHKAIATSAALLGEWSLCAREIDVAIAALSSTELARKEVPAGSGKKRPTEFFLEEDRESTATAYGGGGGVRSEVEVGKSSVIKSGGPGGTNEPASALGTKKLPVQVDDYGNATWARKKTASEGTDREQNHYQRRRQSVALFQRHRNDEAILELQSLRGHCRVAQQEAEAAVDGNAGVASSWQFVRGDGIRIGDTTERYLATLVRVFPLEYSGNGESAPEQVVDRLVRDFGLSRVIALRALALKKWSADRPSNQFEKQQQAQWWGQEKVRDLADKEMAAVREHFDECMPRSGVGCGRWLDFQAIFGASLGTTRTGTGRRLCTFLWPVNIQRRLGESSQCNDGSGGGEVVVKLEKKEMDEREAITIDGMKGNIREKPQRRRASIGVGPSNKKLKAGGSRKWLFPCKSSSSKSNSIMHYQTTDELVAATNTSTLEEYHPCPGSHGGGNGTLGGGGSSSARRKIKMEIGCGLGEWVAAQARAELAEEPSDGFGSRGAQSHRGKRENPVSSVTGWVALEQRHDRVFECIARLHLEKLTNLAVVGPCDAAQVLRQYVRPASVDAIFVNHPEPPERTGRHVILPSLGSESRSAAAGARGKPMKGRERNEEDDKARADIREDESSHLLTPSFFVDMRKALRPNGTLTIVTDNQAYAVALAQSAAVVSAAAVQSVKANIKDGDEERGRPRLAFTSAPMLTGYGLFEGGTHCSTVKAGGGNMKLLREVGGINVYMGQPGREVGHVVQASSFFDRMWTKGQKKRRYILHVQAIEL